MSRRLTAAVGAAVLTAASVGVAVPGPAVAGDEPLSRWVLRDGPGDVLVEYLSGRVVRAKRPTVDITRAVARHGPRAVTVRMRFADLRRVRGHHGFLVVFNRNLHLVFEATPKHWGGRLSMFEDIRNDSLVPCPRLTHDIDYATDVVRFRVPRRCLGTPASVRVHIENDLLRLRSFTDFSDSAHDRDYKVYDGWPPPSTPRLSPPDR